MSITEFLYEMNQGCIYTQLVSKCSKIFNITVHKVGQVNQFLTI